LVLEKLDYIIYNSGPDRYNSKIVKFAYDLLTLREISLLKESDLTENILEELGHSVDIENKTRIIDYLSLLNNKEIQKFTFKTLPRLDDYPQDLHYDIESVNYLLELAKETKNNIMIDTINKWFRDNNFD